jgi:hypothetical protein
MDTRGCCQVDEVSSNIGYLSAMMTTSKSIYRGYRFPADVIEHAVWLYVSFPLSLTDGGAKFERQERDSRNRERKPAVPSDGLTNQPILPSCTKVDQHHKLRNPGCRANNNHFRLRQKNLDQRIDWEPSSSLKDKLPMESEIRLLL